jgi:hypothetical protein
LNLTAALDAPCEPAALWQWVDDLARYPTWLGLVTKAVPSGSDAWLVDLRGRIGPLSRAKRLRMVRTECEEERLAIFERREDDGRQHAAWILRAELHPTASGSHLDMRLHYGGALWGGVLERLLRDEIEHGRQRLLELVSGSTP